MVLGRSGIDSIVIDHVVGDIVVGAPTDNDKTKTLLHITGHALQENVEFFSDISLKYSSFQAAHLLDLAVRVLLLVKIKANEYQ